MILRPLHDSAADARTVGGIAHAAFAALWAAEGRAAPAPGTAQDAEARARSEIRTRHLAATDPGGCWLAEDEDRAVGAVLALRREGLWGLSLLAVVPEAQGKGIGRTLLDHARAYGKSCLRGVVCSTSDPRAARRYHAAGFRLHPAMDLTGPVDPTLLPDHGGIPVHLGDASHLALLDSVDRATRGAAHGPDHAVMLRMYDELLVVDTLAGSGYCYRQGGRITLLAATSQRLAGRLLSTALARIPPGVPAELRNLTAEQDWALDVGLAAGLAVTPRGYVALRGMRPPAPYLPSSAFL